VKEISASIRIIHLETQPILYLFDKSNLDKFFQKNKRIKANLPNKGSIRIFWLCYQMYDGN